MINLLEQIKKHEGFRPKAYQDSVGVWTVGYGKNLQELKISKLQAEHWLTNDVLQAEIELLSTFPVVNTLTKNRQNVLINMTYNLGINKLTKFSKMWEGLMNGDIEEVCTQMKDSLWYKQVGSRADELIEQMRTG